MQWVLIVGGGLLGLLVLVVAVAAVLGALSPEKHTASRQVRVDVPPEQVWRTVTDIERYPSWRPGLRRVELIDDRTWREVGREGTITMRITEADEPRRMVAVVADPTLPYGGAWTCEITPDGGGCVVRMTEDGEVYNIFYRFASRYVFGHTASLEAYLTALGTHHGQRVTPVA
jgi:uncharacterized protein YndB with AHSA1/START domain